MKYKKKSKYFIYIFIFSILINYIKCYYVLPLNQSYENNNKEINNISIIMNNYIKYNAYTIIEIGEPKQKLAVFIKSRDYCSYIGNNLCNIEESNYDYKTSKYFENITPYNLTYKYFSNISLAKEKIQLSTNINNYLNLKEINFTEFYHIINKEESSNNMNTCGVFGFQYKLNHNEEGENKCKSFINNLYDNINTSYIINKNNNEEEPIFSIEYSNDNNNNNIQDRLIIGVYPNIYNSINYKENNYKEIYMNDTSNSIKDKYLFYIKFNEIFFSINNTNISLNDSNYLYSFFILEQNMISVPEKFFELYLSYFFNDYIKNNFCEILLIDNYKTIFCYKKNLDINMFYKSFPSLVFYYSELDIKFEFNSNELFKEDNDYIYFMIYLDNNNNDIFGLGKIFMEKYLFVFNYKNGSIRYYIKSKEIINNFNFIESGIYVLIIFSMNMIVAIICLFVCFYKKCSKNNIDPTILVESFSAIRDNDNDNDNNVLDKDEKIDVKNEEDLKENIDDNEDDIINNIN